MPRPSLGLLDKPVTDGVGQDDAVLGNIERLAWAEQGVGCVRLQELLAASDRAVEHEHRVAAIRGKLPENPAMEPQVGALAAIESECWDVERPRNGALVPVRHDRPLEK